MDDKAEAAIDVEKKDEMEPKTESKSVSLQELQSWWEVPSIAHFCSLFRTAFDLPDFDIEDLEIALLESMKEDENFFLTDLLCRLLKGYYGRDDIQPYNMEIFLKDTIKYNWEMLEKREVNPLANGNFKDLPLRTRVEILQCLCDYRLDATDVMEQLKGLDGDNMRVEPLGKDSTGKTYWYFYGNRLYCEHPEPVKEEPKSEKKDKKGSKKKEKKKEKKQQKSKPKKGRKKAPDPPRRSSRGRILKNSKSLEIDRSETESEEEEDSSSGSDSEMDITLSEISERKKNNNGKDSGRKKRKSNEDDEDEESDEEDRQIKNQKQSDKAPKGKGRQKKTATPKTPQATKSSKPNTSTPARPASTRSSRRSLRNAKKDELESLSKDAEKDEEKDNENEDDDNDDNDNKDIDENSMMSESIADSTRIDEESMMCESKEGSVNGDVEPTEEVKKITPRSTAHSETKRESITDDSTENKTRDNVTAMEEQSETDKEQGKVADDGNTKDKDVKEENTNNSNCNGDVDNTPEEEDKNDVKKDDEPKEDRIPLCLRPVDPDTRWLLICETFEDWQALSEMFKDSKVKSEKELYKCIIEDFLPAIPDIMVARENERKRREAEMAPRRISARIERKKREQLEQEKILADALMEEQKARFAEREEEERKMKEENEKEEKKAREERLKAREERAKRLALREQRAQLIAEGKEIPPELMYVANPSNSKYVDTEDNKAPFELDEETVEAMHNVLESIKAHRDAWPFMEPVSKEDAPDYYDIIKKPMDLSTMEDKLTNREYRNKRKFISDFNLMLDNCRVYNGMDNDFTTMAQRLQKAFYRQVQVHLDKLQTGYEADGDFRVGRSIESCEKRYRPKRAASSRAMDTLHRAMDDAEFEDMTRSSDEEDSDSRSQSPKIIMYPRGKIQTLQNRLIPELSPQQKLGQMVKDQISQHLNEKKKKLEWNPERGTIQITNGQEKFAPYTIKGQVTPDGKKLTLQTAQVIRHNGKTIVYSYGKPKTTSYSKSQDGSQAPANSQENALPSTGQILAQHQQSGGTVKLTPSMTSQLQGKQFTVQTNLGPRIIKIAEPVTSVNLSVSSPAAQTAPAAQSTPAIQTLQTATTGQVVQSPGQSPTQTVRISGMLGNKSITVVDGMLCVDGKKINVPVAGKARILIKGGGTGSVPTSPSVRIIAKAPQQPSPNQASPRPTQVTPSNQATIQLPQSQGQNLPQASKSVLSSVKDKIVAQYGQNQAAQVQGQIVNPVSTISVQGQSSPVGLGQVTIPALKIAGNANSRGIVNIPAINRPGSAIRMIGVAEQPVTKGVQKTRLLPELSPSSGLSGYMPSNVSDNKANDSSAPQNVSALLPTTVLNINKFMGDEVCMQPGLSANSVLQTGGNTTVITGSQTAVMSNTMGNNMIQTQVVSSNQAKGQTEQSAMSSSPLKRRAPDQQAGGTPPKQLSSPSTSNLDLSVVSGHLTDTQKANLIRLLKAKHMLATGSQPDQTQGSSEVPSEGEVLSNVNQNTTSAALDQQPSVIQTTGQAGSLNQNDEHNQHLPIQENLFDKLQTIFNSSSSSVVNSNSCVSTVSQPMQFVSTEGTSQDDPPPVLQPEVKGLSPKYKDKVSLFTANLQSTSLASKLQVLSKSPTKTTNSPIQYVSTSPDNTSRAIVIGQLSPSLQNHLQQMQAAQQANQSLQDTSQTLAGQTIPVQGVTGVLTSGGQTFLSQNIVTVNNGSELSQISNSNILGVNNPIISLSSAANPDNINNPQSLIGQLSGNSIPVQGNAGYTNTTTLSSPVIDSSQQSEIENNQCIDVHVNTGQPGATVLPHTSIGNIILPIFNSSSTTSLNAQVDQNPPSDNH